MPTLDYAVENVQQKFLRYRHFSSAVMRSLPKEIKKMKSNIKFTSEIHISQTLLKLC